MNSPAKLPFDFPVSDNSFLLSKNCRPKCQDKEEKRGERSKEEKEEKRKKK
jgi:hypothetical protein